VDPADRELLVDLENLADEAVPPLDGKRTSVLEPQSVLDDPFVCCFAGGDQPLRADNEMTLVAPHA
jgi:hypothetical protein